LRCLVIQTAFLGDVILTLPLLRILKEHPRVSWTAVLTSPPGPELLESQRVADEIITYDKRGEARGPRSLLAVVGALRALRLDAALIPHRSFRSALIAWLAGVPVRVGFDESGGRFLLNRTVRYGARAHEVERVAGLAEGIGIEPPADGVSFELETPEGAEEELSKQLERRGVGPGDRLVVVAPGSRWATKRWPGRKFAAAGDALAERLGATVALVGSAQDAAECSEVEARMASRAVNLCGVLSLGQTVALAGRAALLLSNDSAAAHIGAGAGAPVVTVFGPTVPAQGFAPYSDRARVVGADIPCRPCGSHGGERCRRGDLACMEAVSVDDIVAAADELLSEPGGEEPPRAEGGGR
jgi:heptosyltransferase-2